MSLRHFYEEPHEGATEASCSEAPVIDAVTKMLSDYADHYDNLIDVGCGANLTYNLSAVERGAKLVGVDFAYNFLRLAPRSDRISLVQADVEQLPLADQSFDAAVCSEVAEHVPDDNAVMREIARVLRPNGLLFFTVPNVGSAHNLINRLKGREVPLNFLDHGHLREYTRATAIRLVAPYFAIEKYYSVHFGWSGLLGGSLDAAIGLAPARILSKSIAIVARNKAAQ
jgi:ubiquinone/menaquinone biosynthesis C-methylase UbiE